MSWTQIRPIFTSAAPPPVSSVVAGSSVVSPVLSSPELPQATRLNAMTKVNSSARNFFILLSSLK